MDIRNLLMIMIRPLVLLMEREMAQQHDHLHSANLRILDSIRMHGRNPLRPRQEGVYQRSGRYGNCKAGCGDTSHFDCKDHNIGPNHVDCCPRRVPRPRAYSSNCQHYHPVSSASPKHGFGNVPWTQHQETAARKIAAQVHMQQLMKSGMLSQSQATRSLHTAASKIQNPPKCAACQAIWKTVLASVSRQNFQCGAGSSRHLEARQLICWTENCSQSLCL